MVSALLDFYGHDLSAADPLAVEIFSITTLCSVLGIAGEIVLDLLTRQYVSPSALLTELTSLLQRLPAANGAIRRTLLAALPSAPTLPFFSSPPVPEVPPRRSVETPFDVPPSAEDVPRPPTDPLSQLPPLTAAARRAATCFLSAASSNGHETEEAVQLLQNSLSPLPRDLDSWVGVAHAAAVLLDSHGTPAEAWRTASRRLEQWERATPHFRTLPREDIAAAATPAFDHSSPPNPLRRCLEDPPTTDSSRAAAQPPQRQPPPSGPAFLSSGPSSAFSTPSHPPPAGPLGPQMPPQPPPAAFSAPPQPHFGARLPPTVSPQLSVFLASVPAQVPRTALEYANALAEVAAPAWYTTAAFAAVSSRAPSAAPLSWSDLIRQEIGAVPWADPSPDPSSWGGAAYPLPSAPFHLPPPTVSDLLSRLGSYNSQRGLFVTDLGRMFVRHPRPGSAAAVDALFRALVHTVRDFRQFSRSGQSISRAERMPDKNDGVASLLEYIDSRLFVADQNAARLRWESKAWTDEHLSALDLLQRIHDDASECGKDDEAVIDRWSGAIQAAFVDFGQPYQLAMLKHSLIDPAVRPFSSLTELLHLLQTHSFGRVTPYSLTHPNPPPTRRHRGADTAATDSALADDLNRSMQLNRQQSGATQRSSSGRAPSTPSPPLSVPGSGAPEAEVLAFQTSTRLVGGHADIPRIQQSGRLPSLVPSNVDIPLHDDGNKFDGKFRLNCPFCGVGSSCRVKPEKAYKSVKEYTDKNGCPPFGDTTRPLPPNERIAHLPSRCPELWGAIRRHVQANAGDAWMRDEPLSDADFYTRVPPHCNTWQQQQRRR